jgi:hypothetical protein
MLLNDTSGKTLWPKGIDQQVDLEIQFLTQSGDQAQTMAA